MNTTSHELRTLTDLSATDFACAPDAAEIYIAEAGRVLGLSVTTGQTRELEGVSNVAWLDVSSEGRLAVARSTGYSGERFDLSVMDLDGSGELSLVRNFLAIHGVGPVWSPDGSRIVIQQGCDAYTDVTGAERVCREQHVALVVDVADVSYEIAPPEILLPEWSTGSGALQWLPWSVTWSPDGTSLLYVAWSEGDVSRTAMCARRSTSAGM